MAHLKAAASMRQQQQLAQQAQQAQQLKLFKHVPARLPPSQQVITDWLDAESAMHAPPASSSSSSRAAAAQAAAGSGFVMDANTGRLVPLQASATQVAILPKFCSMRSSTWICPHVRRQVRPYQAVCTASGFSLTLLNTCRLGF